ncbi:MAG: VOC family protein [SAR324 cluster bacterium]|nr:VOC family protein [SAR324 cluster bacterium]MCH8885967.1 VOC family protein [SAR324 cluster bacterium]
MAHIILTVRQFEKARDFYCALLPNFGMTLVFDGPDFCYHVGGRTAIGIRRCDPEYQDAPFEQYRAGLHHLCLRARTRGDVDKTAALLSQLDAKIVRGPEAGGWAPGYYYVLFEDPDGIRIEINHVPGKGLLKEGERLGSGEDYHRIDGKDVSELK